MENHTVCFVVSLVFCQKYHLPSPLHLMENETVWSKNTWKCLVKTKITVYYENKLRTDSKTNSKMRYLNVQLCGLSVRPHTSLLDILTTQDARKLRHHLKFLTGDFLTAERLALDQPSLDPACKLCLAPVESTEHVLVSCSATADIRQRILPELMNTVAHVQPNSYILNNPPASQLAQFILDCTSINLEERIRIPAHNPGVSQIFRVSRDWCYAVSSERARLLHKKQKALTKTTPGQTS